MAIGLPLPTTHASGLRLSWRHARTVFARQAPILKASILRVVSVTHVLWNRLSNAAQNLLNLRARARQRQRALFIVFEQQYDNLVDLLCASAHEGIRPDREIAYARTRSWMLAHYPCIARHIRPHWQIAAKDAVDPFLALFTQSALDGVINEDDAIHDIMRSRMALEAYRVELDTSTA